jgi:hypothetical protein
MMHNLGVMLLEAQRCKEAIEVLERAVAVRRAVLRPGHTDLALTLLQLGRCHVQAGAPETAEPLLREGLDIAAAGFPAGHWQVDLQRIELGACLAAQRRFDEAEPVLVEGFESMRSPRRRNGGSSCIPAGRSPSWLSSIDKSCRM